METPSWACPLHQLGTGAVVSILFPVFLHEFSFKRRADLTRLKRELKTVAALLADQRLRSFVLPFVGRNSGNRTLTTACAGSISSSVVVVDIDSTRRHMRFRTSIMRRVISPAMSSY